MKPERRQVLECVTKWLSPGIQEQLRWSMTEKELETVNKIIINIAIAIRTLPEGGNGKD